MLNIVEKVPIVLEICFYLYLNVFIPLLLFLSMVICLSGAHTVQLEQPFGMKKKRSNQI